MYPPIDYAEIGLMCGLEVHQQLLTDLKLFCRCPAGRYTREHDGTVLRHMRPTLSELGEYDGTALMEFKTKKNIVYLLHRSNVCTYEMDDTPPFLMNAEALDIAIEQCLMLGCDIVDEVHIARKQYLDGSIPTGFQRTAIVGVNGTLPFRGRKIHVTQVSVEEDSCREVSDRGHLIVWRTDRLGMPLIETVTGPDLRTPEEAAEAILLVGRVCRSTGHVRVGLGASRQDVNVSVRGGSRVEIKGVPRAAWAVGLVHGEAVRQVNLLRLRDELHRRGFTGADSIQTEHMDVTELFASSPLAFLRRENFLAERQEDRYRVGFEMLEGPFCVRAVRLIGLAGTLSWPTQPEFSFAHELAGRVKVIACLDQQPILLHSEKWPDYAGATQELRRLKDKLGCRAEDAVVVLWGVERDTLCAAEEIRLRYVDACRGVPAETRQPFADGSTFFERILPGPDRMYPDTDSPPQRIVRERVTRLAAELPETPWLREARYQQAGLSQATTYFLIRRGGARIVDRLVRETGIDLRRAGILIGEHVKGLRRQRVPVDAIGEQRWCELVRAMLERPALADAWRTLVTEAARFPERNVEDLLQQTHFQPPAADWQDVVETLVATRHPDHPRGTREQLRQFLMGLIMKQLRGRVPAQQVLAVLQASLERQA
jgi:glutamyl-tRNA(Gln) amidotransferase subunit E